jgi:quinol monooxygenase YgiN
MEANAATTRHTMTPQGVRMTVRWFVPGGEMAAITVAMQTLMTTTRAQPGCVSCSLSSQLGTKAGFTYVEEWKTEQDLKSQLRSERFAKLAHLMEGATERPTVEFTLPGGTRGMDYAEEVHGRQGEVP